MLLVLSVLFEISTLHIKERIITGLSLLVKNLSSPVCKVGFHLTHAKHPIQHPPLAGYQSGTYLNRKAVWLRTS